VIEQVHAESRRAEGKGRFDAEHRCRRSAPSRVWARGICHGEEHGAEQGRAERHPDLLGSGQDPAGDPEWRDLVDALDSRSPDFRDMWAQHEVSGPATRRKRYQHPTVGPLAFTATHLALADHADVRLIVYLPSDEESESTFSRLMREPRSARPWHPDVLA